MSWLFVWLIKIQIIASFGINHQPITSTEKARILSAVSENQLNLCHQVLVESPNEDEATRELRQEFVKSSSVPLMSYEWSMMANSPPETVLRRTPSMQIVDDSQLHLKNDYCVAYFLITSKNLVPKAIKEIAEFNWFPGSARYLVFFLNEEVPEEELEKLSEGGGNILHLVYITKKTPKPTSSIPVSLRNSNRPPPATFVVTKICHFCHDGKEGPLSVGKWIPETGLKMAFPLLGKDPKDFQKHTFRGVTLKFPPYITYTKTDDDKLIPGDSLDIRIMDTIASVYNFSFELIEPFDQMWGYQLENGSFTGVLGTVSRREADFSMNLLITAEREIASDFTIGYLDDPLTFAFASPKPLPQWLSLIRPYSEVVWICFLLSIVLVGPIYWIGLKLSVTRHEMSVFSSSFELFGAMVSQSRYWRATNGVRVFVGFWLLFSLVVTRSYVGNLVAHLMVPALSPTINTLEELVKSDFKWGIADFGASNYQLFKTSTVPLYQKIFRGMDLCPSTRECLERSAKEQYAFISWRNNMRESIEENFKDENGKALIYLARQDFFPSDIGFALQMGSSLKDPFDEVILRLLEAGLVPKWLTDIIEKSGSKKGTAAEEEKSDEEETDSAESNTNTLYLHHLQGLFIVYCVGVIFSMAVFGVEYLIHKILSKYT